MFSSIWRSSLGRVTNLRPRLLHHPLKRLHQTTPASVQYGYATRAPGKQTSKVAIKQQYVAPIPAGRSPSVARPTISPPSFWTTARAIGLAIVTGTAVYVGVVATYDTRVDPTADKSTLLNVRTIPEYGSESDMKKAIAAIRTTLGDDFVSTEGDDLLTHGYSTWSTSNVDRLPAAVVYPRTTTEVSEIAKICHNLKIPMIPFCAGSSLEGNFCAPYGGISIDFTHMDKIIKLRENDLDVTVQPAVSWMTLNETIKESGLFFPIDPGPTAKIGGMVATNCSGTNAVRYGTMKDWVINLTVVLADGTIIKTRRRPRKTSAGYNLNSLFVGSEGTLGMVTEATLKLAVVPAETRIAVVAFPSVRDATAAATKIIRSGVQVAAMELMDEVHMKILNKSKSTDKVWQESPTIFFKFTGNSASVKHDVETVRTISKDFKSGDFQFAKTPEEQKKLWQGRKEAFWNMLSQREDEGNEAWSTDVAVPMSHLADIIEKSKKDLDKLGLYSAILGHIGDGNFHSSILYDKKKEGDLAKLEKAVHDMVDMALDMEGTCTGEHGIGIGKKEYLVKELGIDTLSLMRKIKYALDPLWLLNPGKIVDVISPKLQD